jgi:hypothetical protein
MAQAIKCLPNKCKALSSNPNTIKINFKKEWISRCHLVCLPSVEQCYALKNGTEVVSDVLTSSMETNGDMTISSTKSYFFLVAVCIVYWS